MCDFNNACPGNQDQDGFFWPCQSPQDCPASPASSCRFAVVGAWGMDCSFSGVCQKQAQGAWLPSCQA